ncbi:MAG: RES family NAD+ phosphorylase [Pseudomonadota bacterium]
MSLVVWRLSKRKHIATALTGIGAREAGGRWNAEGTALVYTSASLALAALELFVHLPRAFAKLDFVSFRIEIPGGIPVESLTPERLPPNWRQQPPPDSTQTLGTRWAAAGTSAVLQVPSVLVPSESNYLLNPAHPDFRRLVIADPESFTFDPRLWK